ncbi:MAG: LysE family translocator [Arcobacter sp.]|nr:LysE family translocator [Arcobacter sp.]
MLAAILFIIPLAWTPGPVNITLAAVGSTEGFKNSFKFIIGINIAFFLQAILISLGLNKIFLQFPEIENIIKISGSAYIAYLGYKMLRLNSKEKTLILSFLNGFIISILNPKVWITLIIYFSVFDKENSPSILILSIIATTLFFIGNSAWCLFGATLKEIIKNEKYKVVQNQIFSFLLFGISIYILFS